MNIRVSSKTSVNRSSELYQTLLEASPRIAAKDFTLWGKEAEAESSIRLNWIDLPSSSRALLPELSRLQEWISKKGLTTFVLAGMGGSSLGPEVLAKTFKKSLIVLDSTDPDQIMAATPLDLSNVAVIVGSKSGSTAETASQKAYFTQKFIDAGLDPRDHFVIVTDPDSPFDIESRALEYFVINADPNVGGRFSVLSAFGLVPAAALGIDVSELLNDAHEASQSFLTKESAAIEIACLVLEAKEQNIAFFDSESQVPGLSDWIEQLIAESTGKEGKGFFPIAIESKNASISGPALTVGFAPADVDIVVEALLGAQFILWEWVTALIAVPLQINPYDQPNVQDAKVRAFALLNSWGNKVPRLDPVFETSNIQVFSNSKANSLSGQIDDFLKESPHYIAIMAYLARGIDDRVTQLRSKVAEISGVGTSFGWGPRFLHSTGQYHKGGQQNGAFIQITGENSRDLNIPGKEFSFHTLLMAQALGDGEALGEKKLPLLRFHLKNREAGINELIEAFKS